MNHEIIFVFGSEPKENKSISIFESKLEYVRTIKVEETEILVYRVKGTRKRAYFLEDGEIEVFGEKFKKLRLLNAEEFTQYRINETYEQSANKLLAEVSINE